jgi:hypothetical protein
MTRPTSPPARSTTPMWPRPSRPAPACCPRPTWRGRCRARPNSRTQPAAEPRPSARRRHGQRLAAAVPAGQPLNWSRARNPRRRRRPSCTRGRAGPDRARQPGLLRRAGRAGHAGLRRGQKTAVSEQLASAKRNFEVGTSTITDTREAQARFDLVTAQEIAAENDLRVKRSRWTSWWAADASPPLARPVNLPGLMPATSTPGSARPIDAAPGDAPGRARRWTSPGWRPTRPRPATAHAGPARQLRVTANRRQHQPGGTARTNYGQRRRGFNLPLFAGFAVQNRIRKPWRWKTRPQPTWTARAASRRHPRGLLRRAVSGMGQVKALEAAEASSQSALDANKLGYQVGVRINIDVLNARASCSRPSATWPRPATTCCWAT